MDTIKSRRNAAIRKSIDKIRHIMAQPISVPRLEQAKSELMALCERRELFPRSDFPIPEHGVSERTFLVYQDDNGEYALYVNSGNPDQKSPPHNHGGSWAIVAAIEGEETHHLYVENEDRESNDGAPIRKAAEICVKPGCAVSMMPEGIHSIHAGDQPLLHLHLYGRSFESQSQRKQFDLETGEVRRFVLDDVGFIEDAR